MGRKTKAAVSEKAQATIPGRKAFLRITVFFPLVFVSLLAWFFVSCSPEGRACESNDDCSFGTYCEGQVCKKGCRLSIECPKGEVCKQNLCVRVLQDSDEDGYPVPLDCDDGDPNINPGVQEICGNNKDDNCNGKIDEVPCIKVECQPGISRECYDGKEQTLTFPSTLCKKGRQFCTSGGVWGDCQGQVLPSPERCDGEDNDCDGQIDEGEAGKPLTQACFSGPQDVRKKGLCTDGEQVCDNGRFTPCKGEILPATEVCDGEDNDCDGLVDNLTGTGSPCAAPGQGECSLGERRCDLQTKAVVCVATKTSSPEICGDGKDNDCDGQIDNGCPYTPIKIAEILSYPHFLAASEDRLVVSLRDTKRLAVFDTSKEPPSPLPSATFQEPPYGVLLQDRTAYAVTVSALLSVDLEKSEVKTVATFPFPSHAGDLRFFGGRFYTRVSGQDPQGVQQAGLCRTALADPKTECSFLSPLPTTLSLSLEQTAVYLLLLTESGVHFFDTLGFAEDQSRKAAFSGIAGAFALDEKTSRLIAIDPTLGDILIYDTKTNKASPTRRITDEVGKPAVPGSVAVSQGFAYIGHRNGSLISEIDLVQEKEVQRFRVGLGVTGLSFSPLRPDRSRILYAACAADSTLWQILIPPP